MLAGHMFMTRLKRRKALGISVYRPDYKERSGYNAMCRFLNTIPFGVLVTSFCCTAQFTYVNDQYCHLLEMDPDYVRESINNHAIRLSWTVNVEGMYAATVHHGIYGGDWVRVDQFRTPNGKHKLA